MVLPGEIQRVEISEFKDKQTGAPVRNYRILVGDKTKVFCASRLFSSR